MKELKFPKAITLRLDLDRPDPLQRRPSSLVDEMAVIEKNGTEILSAMVMIEDRIIEAVSKILFTETGQNRNYRDFFVSEIMGTSDFSFSFKRRVFTRLLEEFKLLGREKIKSLKADLNKLMLWRNAFAHGQVLHDQHDGYVLQYYSGGHKEQVLNDDFFEKVDSTVRNCLYVCNGIIQSHART
ncbi:hypothetical protein [Marinobacter bohaiensis]|uniref:hypothetical protein n=1 Tax=Marinobacter bohaiensis TaxID=2201898 RepID=UPI000DAEF860|nr:hypothetical protein [Marinobacter bohaiensis]